jgi:hypothetical protein
MHTIETIRAVRTGGNVRGGFIAHNNLPLSKLAQDDVNYFTNGALGWTDEPPPPARFWSPATSATLDTGILAKSMTKAVCLWVEDED